MDALTAICGTVFFLSFDLPAVASLRPHYQFTAIPKEVLAHMKIATGMEINCRQTDIPPNGTVTKAWRSSKIKALLSDLSMDERSVVFTSSRDRVQHLLVVLNDENIGCRALFNGQDTKDSQQAITDWELQEGLIFPNPVLIIQAGAAASGLTLTKASRMFLMEPFSRQEEEKQAFARCHRFGQTKHVHVKCYYTPVSTESRMLDWRKKAASSDSQGILGNAKTNVVYAQMSDVIYDDDDYEDDDGDDDDDDNDNDDRKEDHHSKGEEDYFESMSVSNESTN